MVSVQRALALTLCLGFVATASHGGEAQPESLSGPMTYQSEKPGEGEEQGPPRSFYRGGGPSFEEEVAELVNQERWTNGQRPPLKHIDMLDSSSQVHTDNMASRNFFAHCDLDTLSSPGDRMTAAGYQWNSVAENISAGRSTPASVMAGWMGSSGHRANILSTDYREIGIGYTFQSGDQGNVRIDNTGNCQANLLNQGPYRHYWTQNFGRRNTVYPVVINREAYMTTERGVDLYLYGSGWAQDMRLRNENAGFTSWQPFSTNFAWNLSPGSGTKTVTVEIRNGGTVRSHSDTIVYEGPTDLIFADNFESGQLISWPLASP